MWGFVYGTGCTYGDRPFRQESHVYKMSKM